MSSIYFDNDLALNDYANVTCIAWSKGEEQPLLAVADGCTLRIFREGEELLDYNQERQGLPCTALAWHPTSKVIAAGWEDGAVTFTGPGAVNARDDREVHRDARILSIVFNPNGTRCVTTDNNGVVGVWKTDQRGLCNQMCHYRKSGAHDKVIFRTATPTGEPNLENPPFFFGGEQGIIYLADDFGLCSERYKIGSPLLLLEYYREKDVVVLVTKSVILVQFSLSADGKVTNESKLKLSCGPTPEKLQGCWAGPGLLATCSHESILRIWNLADDENYILSLQGIDERNSLSGDKVTSVDYNPRKQVLACGTRGGRMVQWRSSTLSGVPKSESNWQVLPVVSVGECAVDKLTWGPGEGLIHARTERSSVILSEAQLNTAVQAPLMAVQSSPMEIIVYHTERQVHLTVTANYRVKGLGVGPSTVLLWNNKNVTLYDVDVTFQATVLSSFGRSTEMAAAALICQGQDRSIAIASGSKIEITNSQGVVQKTIQFSEEVEGYPVSLDVSGGFLVASTSMSFLKLWNVSKSTPKQLGATRKFEGFAQQPLGEIRSVRVNKDGTRVSLLVDQRLNAQGVPAENGTLKVPDARIFVYDTDSDNFLEYQVGQSCVPVAHFWDSTDARLLCCEVVPQALAYSEKPMPPEENKKAPSHCAITLFIATSEQILLQDNISCIDPENHSVTRMPAGLIVPHVYFSRLGTSEDGGDPITKNVLRDFAGLENMDEETTAALLNFSYHLACGNTDEAYKSVKGVRSSNVWESMSKMCVKTGRLDVAQKCLGQMSHARAAGALRQCPEQEPEARLAVVAVHLDMIDDAEQLLKQCGRYDLLNQLYQASGNWEKALDVAKTKDRIHLKPTHYAYAQHLEALEDVEGALTHYEFSGTYRTESPRLLCSMGMTEELGNYVEKSDDSHLHRWYAQFLESKADLDGAAREYTKAMRLWLCAACLALAVAARRLGSEIKGSPHTQGLEGSVVDGEYGRYQLVKELGGVAYGTVYMAKEQNGRQVVAKVIDIRTEEQKFSFLTERRVWKHMQRCPGYPHPNVIQYFEALQMPNKRGVVMMELAGGGSLSETLYNKVSAESTLGGTRTALGDALLTDEALAKKLFGQLAAGAQWLGKCGVVHKDLKPDNVMLTKPFLEGGIIKIIDFGLAMLTSDQRGGPVANFYYNLRTNAAPSNKKGARTFDDFALGLMLAEIGTGVPPYFNPDFDYYSRKQGNLQNEKGIFYILQPKKVCEKGDAEIKVPKNDLAGGKVSIKTAVKEVVGRSLYYLQNGHHFIHTSATEQGIGNVQLLKKSWLYNSPSAMSLLYSLMAGRQEDRIEPSTLMSTEWLSDVESPAPSSPVEMPQEMETFAPPSPAISEDVQFSPPEPPLEEDLPEEEEEVEVEKEEAPKLNMCKNPYKERGPASLCKVRHSSHGDCYVDVSCSGAPSKKMKLEQGWGAGTVPNCRNCQLS